LREYRRFNTVGTQLRVRHNPSTHPGTSNPVDHFLACMNGLFEHALQGAADSDMVWVPIRNDVIKKNIAVGVSFRRTDKLSAEVIWTCSRG
jgi:hypothetical protein